MNVVADWPRINAKVWLRLPCCNEEHPTRVEDYAGESDCVVSAPDSAHDQPVDVSTLTDGFFLGWPAGRNAIEMPVTLVSAASEPVPTWRLAAIGEPVETQRRRFVRIEYETDVALHLLESGPPTHAVTTSISEGGFSCDVDRWAIDPHTRNFRVEMQLRDKTHSLLAKAAWWGPLDEGYRSIGIEFIDAPPHTADEIRSFVFAEQLRQRRAAD